MKITEIIQTDYEEQTLNVRPTKWRNFDLFSRNALPFRGTREQWRARIKKLLPDVQDLDFKPYPYIDGPNEQAVIDGRTVGQWEEHNGGTGTLPMHTNTLGTGAYAAVQQTRDPFVVRKKSKQVITQDPYKIYVKNILNLMANNPFFPRVYLVKVQKYDKQERPSYDMEKLYSHEKLDYETMAGLALKYFPEKESEIAATGSRDYVWAILTRSVEQLARDIYKEFQKMLAKPDIQKTHNKISDFFQDMQQQFSNRDPQLIEALTLIVGLSVFKNLELDMHTGNSMIRFTPAGPQLVFTDPLA